MRLLPTKKVEREEGEEMGLGRWALHKRDGKSGLGRHLREYQKRRVRGVVLLPKLR